MKVNQLSPAAAPHHPPGRDRRIDASRQQARHAAADPDRQAASAALLAEEVKRALRAPPRRESSSSGAPRLTAHPRRQLDARADVAAPSRRGDRNTACRTPAADAERAGVRSPRSARMASPRVVEIGGGAAGPGEVGDAADGLEPRTAHRSSARGAEHELHPSHQRADAPTRRVRRGEVAGCASGGRRTTGGWALERELL